jgi:hypothetical protein
MKWSHNKLIIEQVKKGDPRQTYAGLLWWQQQKQYKRGWVAMKFREIFGKWPAPCSPVEAIEPGNDLKEYLGIMLKRWKAKKKREERKNAAPIDLENWSPPMILDDASPLMTEEDWSAKL